MKENGWGGSVHEKSSAMIFGWGVTNCFLQWRHLAICFLVKHKTFIVSGVFSCICFQICWESKHQDKMAHTPWKEESLLVTYTTVKLARTKLPANAGNFTCSSQVKRCLAQFTCVTCSLPVNTGKFTCFEAASTSRRTHANCLRAHVNLPEYHRHFTGSFTCGTHANLPATSMQNCLLLQAKLHATYRQKH